MYSDQLSHRNTLEQARYYTDVPSPRCLVIPKDMYNIKDIILTPSDKLLSNESVNYNVFRSSLIDESKPAECSDAPRRPPAIPKSNHDLQPVAVWRAERTDAPLLLRCKFSRVVMN
ncbi:jg13569 [Pararge aegeria aegeria]|uniref:Jg13569 protein n=1 Tax=Pararge aegeria aegeria TaxID=348720 RepID=A0A8S4QZA6_9NEOP|nr:jg13569 [Pararge aegeria aegeria]